jgi:hypothetical protein
MNANFKFSRLLSIFILLYSPASFTQEQQETAPGDSSKSASQEVEITEDNYRQFMELKDARQQRRILPEDAFKPKAGLQKIDKLPEDSQKHLRNQLREIIVQGDKWQPGDEGKHFPYVPSEAAVSNQALQEQEAAAWGELVDNYHRREREIYENSARTQAAMADEGSTGSNTGNGSPGDGTGQPGAEQQDAQQAGPDQVSSADSYSPNASNSADRSGTQGVSQNAMEYLQKMAQQDTGGTGGSPASIPQNGNEGEDLQQSGQPTVAAKNPGMESTSANASENTQKQGEAGASQNAMEFLQEQSLAGQGGAGPGENTSSPVGDSAQGDAQEQSEQQADSGQGTSKDTSTASDSNSSSVAGTSQNAMEFLQQNENQGDGASAASSGSSMADNEQGNDNDPAQDGQDGNDEQQTDSSNPSDLASAETNGGEEGESSAGVSQNALEFLTGEETQPGRGREPAVPPENPTPAGTLNIQDLINARGVGSSSGAPPIIKRKEKQDPEPPPSDGSGP